MAPHTSQLLASNFHRFVFALGLLALLSLPNATAHANDEAWQSIREQIFGERTIHDGASKFSFFAPSDAEDAAIVPISIRLPGNLVADVRKLTVVIDRNPAPVAAKFEFGPGYKDPYDIGERELATRIRVDSFSNVRAILETADGNLYMQSRFVAGAGGCSAPSSKDPDEALAHLGEAKVKVKRNAMRGANWREGVVMIRHPNFTGMQMNAKTGNYTPSRFVRNIEIRRAGQPMLAIEGGISISENPHFRFSYGGEAGNDHLALNAIDTQDVRITGRSDTRSSMLDAE